jgi:hypothetical protein
MAEFHIDEPREIGKKKKRIASREIHKLDLIMHQVVENKLRKFVRKIIKQEIKIK